MTLLIIIACIHILVDIAISLFQGTLETISLFLLPKSCCFSNPVLGAWGSDSLVPVMNLTPPQYLAILHYHFFSTTASRNFRFQDVSALASMTIISVNYYSLRNFKDFKILCFLILPLHISSGIVRPSIIPHKLSFIISF